MGIRPLHIGNEEHWLRELSLLDADPVTWERLRNKSRISIFITGPLPPVAANILKQCMLSGGADAIVSRNAVSCRTVSTRAMLVGTPKQLLRGCASLQGQPFGLTELAVEIRSALEHPPEPPLTMPAGRGTLDFGSGPLVMGILNITPDSFSDGGLYLDRGDAVSHGLGMAALGADIVDVGAESTRPGSLPVPPEEQLDRMIPVIHELSAGTGTVISVDTTSAEVAEAAIAAGAGMINDVSALSDPGMAPLAARTGVPLVLMHMQGTPETMQERPGYDDVLQEVYSFLERKVGEAVSRGVPRERIIVDPGIGFGKRMEDNLLLISRIAEFRWIGCRVMLGHSRKSFIGELTGIREASKREAGTHAVTALSSGSADIFRVHDVEGTRQVLRVSGKLGFGS